MQPPAGLCTGWGCSGERRRHPKRSVIFGTINKCCPSRRRELQKGAGWGAPRSVRVPRRGVPGAWLDTWPRAVPDSCLRAAVRVLFRAMLIQPRLRGDGGQEEPLHVSSALLGSFEFL